MADPGKPFSLKFLSRDLRNQIAHSKDILGQIEELQKALEKVGDADARLKIESAIRHLLAIAQSMATNVATTTSTATSSVSGSTSHYILPDIIKPRSEK